MKIMILAFVMTGCGTYHVSSPKVVDDSRTDTSTGSSTGTDTGSEQAKNGPDGLPFEKATNTTEALAFGESVQLKSVAKLYSATKIVNTLYFTGEDASGIPVLGKVKPGSSTPQLLPFGKLGAGAISLDGRYYLVSNTDDAIYLMNDTKIIGIDLVTLRAKSEQESACSDLAPFTFIKDGRWFEVWNSTSKVCGITDGATISADKPIVDDYTGQPLRFDNYSSFSYDGISVYEYSRESATLSRFTSKWQKQVTYSTSSYLYNGPEASFVSDTNGNMWMLGCDANSECFVTTVTVVQQ